MPMLHFRLVRPGYVIDINRLADLATVVRAPTADRRSGPSYGSARERSALIRGTLGGSLAHADPAAELPAAMVVLGTRLTLRSARGGAASAMAGRARHRACKRWRSGVATSRWAALPSH